MKYQKSAEVILANWIYTICEGLNDGRIFVVSSKEEEIDTKTVTNELLEKILSKDNLNMAFKRVKANKGASGIDDMKVDELLQYLKEKRNINCSR